MKLCICCALDEGNHFVVCQMCRDRLTGAPIFVETKYAMFGSDLVEPAAIDRDTHLPGLVRNDLVSCDQGHYTACNDTACNDTPLGLMIGHEEVFISPVNVSLSRNWAAGRPTSTVFNTKVILQFNTSVASGNVIIARCFPLVVSATGSGFYLRPMRATPKSSSQGVLSARTPPAFAESEPGAVDEFQVTHELYAGARIVISGLIRSGETNWPPPEFRDVAGTLQALSIEEWESSTGKLTLRVLDGDAAPHTPVVAAGEMARFALEFEMPSARDEDDSTPEITVEVVRAGPRQNCDFVPLVKQFPSLLKASERTQLSFPTRQIGSSTCFPGECNTFTITFTPNKKLSQEDDEVRIVILGLAGIDNSATCNVPVSCGDPDPKSIPLSDAVDGTPALARWLLGVAWPRL